MPTSAPRATLSTEATLALLNRAVARARELGTSGALARRPSSWSSP